MPEAGQKMSLWSVWTELWTSGQLGGYFSAMRYDIAVPPRNVDKWTVWKKRRRGKNQVLTFFDFDLGVHPIISRKAQKDFYKIAKYGIKEALFNLQKLLKAIKEHRTEGILQRFLKF